MFQRFWEAKESKTNILCVNIEYAKKKEGLKRTMFEVAIRKINRNEVSFRGDANIQSITEVARLHTYLSGSDRDLRKRVSEDNS